MGHATGGLFAAAVLAIAGLVTAGTQAQADGALAVGTTGDVVKDGIAFGMVVNEPKGKAAELAVQRCRTFKARAAAERCKVVATFTRECFAVAYDPKSGTPGAGWGIGPDQLTANLGAIAMCEKSAGSDRAGFCQVESGGCDSHAQGGGSTAEAAPPPPTAETAPPKLPDDDQRWTDLRKSLNEEQRAQSDWDMPMLLLLVASVGWVVYALSHAWRGRAAKADAGKGKAEAAKSKPAKGGASKASKARARRSRG